MVNIVHFPELDVDAPRVQGRPFPYVKAIQQVKSIGPRSTIETKPEIKYFNIRKHLVATRGHNLAIERLALLKKRGCKFIGYGYLDLDNPHAREVVEYLSDDHFIMLERDKQKEINIARAAAEKQAAEDEKARERESLMAELKAELRKEMEQENKTSKRVSKE